MESIESIGSIVRELPPEQQQEVIEYVMHLSQRAKTGRRRSLKLDWAGGLSYLADKTTSVDLQHTISRLRI
jgi:Protein of unknown function (DUF2281)